MKHGTFTLGTTPEATIRHALAEACGNRAYPMELVGDDAKALRKVVLRRLGDRRFLNSEFHWQGHRLVCAVDHDDMLVILRRLFDEGSDTAWSLRSGILQSLEIEEI